MKNNGKDEDRPGIRFQNLLAVIEKAISADEHTKVESPAHLYDHAGGAQREFDVLITFEKNHHRNLTAIECKDHGRKIDVGVIDSYASKLADCGVHRGIIVSAQGFTQTVVRKARAKGIQLMTLRQAEDFDWLMARSILSSHRTVRCKAVMFGISGGPKVAEPYLPYSANGEIITGERLNSFALQVVPESSARVDQDITEEFNVRAQVDDVYIVDAHGERFNVTELLMQIETVTTSVEMPFDLHAYTGEGTSTYIASAAMSATPNSPRLVLVQGEDGISVRLVTKPS